MYYLTTKSSVDFDATVSTVRLALQQQGFGIISEINLQAKLQEKTGADVGRYLILGACHPPSALSAVQAEPNIGVMLPCNVIVRESNNCIEVSAINPQVSMRAIKNPALHGVAATVQQALQNVIHDVRVRA